MPTISRSMPPSSYLHRRQPEPLRPDDQMTFLDSIEFVHDILLRKLHINSQLETVVLHPVCLVTKLGLTPKLEAIAQACSDRVLIPFDAGCCAFAGDHGFLLPELTGLGHASGSRRSEIDEGGCLLLQQSHLRDRHDPRHGAGVPVLPYLLERATR